MIDILKKANFSRFKFLGFFILIYLLRMIVSQSMGLMPQDAYYHFYSEELDWSYFDHPPMVAYMLKLFTSILGHHVWVIKLTDFTVSLLGFYGFYYLANLILSKERAWRATLLYGSTIVLTILSMNTTPDVPLMCMWTWSMVFAYKAVSDGKWYHWLLAGLFMGFAFDSKYTALMLPAGFILYLLLSKSNRKYLFSPQLLLSVIVFFIAVYPIYYWNVEHDWISFKFQSSGRASSIMKFELKPVFFLGNIGTQLGLLIPILFVMTIGVLYKRIIQFFKKMKLPSEKVLFLLSFSLPTILFFFGVSIFYWVKLNWLMPGYLAAIILVGMNAKYKWIKIQYYISIIFHLILIGQLWFNWVPIKSDDTWVGWEDLSEEVISLSEVYPDHFIFAEDDYKTSAVLRFYTGKEIYSRNIVGGNGLQFNVRYPDLSMLKGKNAIFIDSDPGMKHLKKVSKESTIIRPYFESIEQITPIIINNKKGKPVRKFYVYLCSNYKGIDN